MLDIDFDRLLAAYEKARDDLLAERSVDGHWVGELASSALATATAVSALSLVQGSRFKVQGQEGSGFASTAFGSEATFGSEPQGRRQARRELVAGRVEGASKDEGRRTKDEHGGQPFANLGPGTRDLGPLIARGIGYLATQQNEDGGFGDTDLSHSNIATTMLVRAAFHLAGAAADEQHRQLLKRAGEYIEINGAVAALRARYGKDKTFAVPILTNCALAGLVDWREVNPLPFELAAFPQSWYRFFRLPVVSYAIPALVAIGQARYFHLPPRNPVIRALRRATLKRTLKVLEQMQPDSGGYLEAIPLTSFVMMSLAGTGRPDHRVARRGVRFLLDTVRPDGSWPIDTNLATWVTTLSINALEGSEFRARGSASPKSQVPSPKSPMDNNRPGMWDLGLADSTALVEWLLGCQHTQRHPFTGAAPGGWGWSDLRGAVPDADDTAGALLALAKFATTHDYDPREFREAARFHSLIDAATDGMRWLAALQNRDGGWPTFCRGWGTLPFDRSSPDLTAHAMRAIDAWLPPFDRRQAGVRPVVASIDRGFRYLTNTQRSDGSWIPLWFGNQDHPDEENPVYGTGRVLLAYRDLGRMKDSAAVRGVRWLIANQNADSGWGSCSPKSQLPGPRSSAGAPGTWDLGPGTLSPGDVRAVLNSSAGCGSSVEETAWAVEGLLAGLDNGALSVDNSLQNAIRRGIDWLVCAVEDDRHRRPAPVGFYFAKLWYYERLYPLAFTVSALSEAVGRLRGTPNSKGGPVGDRTLHQSDRGHRCRS